jgi:tetratricopeptide (TPR) repeat protein
MAEERIEQKVTIKDQAQVHGNISIIGKVVNIVNNPAEWQDSIFRFLSTYRYVLILIIALEIALLALYWVYKDLHLIPWWLWGQCATLLSISVWSWYTHIRKPGSIARLTVAGSASLLFFFLIGWQTWHVVYPPAFQPQVFGIAVAEISKEGMLRQDARTREITNQIYERLCLNLEREYAARQSDAPCADLGNLPDDRRVAVRRIGVVLDSKAAEEYGSRIRADVVIWGQLLSDEQAGVTLRFEVRETLDRAVNPDFPVVMPVTTSSTEILGVERDVPNDPFQIKEVAAQQAIIISSYVLGLIAYLDQDFPEAARQLALTIHIIERNPFLHVSDEGLSLIYFYLARAHIALGRVATGVEHLIQAQVANPAEPAIFISLALAYGSIGPPEGLDENLELALAKLNAWLLTNPNDSNALFDRGLVYEIQRKYANAAIDYEALLRNDPAYYIAYIQLGLVTYELGQFDEAVNWLRQGIARAEMAGTNPASAYVRLGEIYEKADQVGPAKQAYQQAIRYDPAIDRLYYFYAKFLENQGEMDAALHAYQEMAEVSHVKSWAYGELGSFYRRRSLLNNAVISYQRAINADHANPLLHTYLAETYWALGETDKALQAFAEAINRNERAAIYYVYESYAGVLFELGEFLQAAIMYERTLALRPINYPALLNLGRTYEEVAQIEDAIDSYCRIIELEGAFSEQQIQVARMRIELLSPEVRCR